MKIFKKDLKENVKDKLIYCIVFIDVFNSNKLIAVIIRLNNKLYKRTIKKKRNRKFDDQGRFYLLFRFSNFKEGNRCLLL